MATKIKIALIQMLVGAEKAHNLSKVEKIISNCMKIDNSIRLICLPECFNSPYGIKYFEKNAEHIPNGLTSLHISNLAKQNGVYIVAGSIPEKEDHELYNTSAVFDPNGQLIAKHRKVHLFDIDIKDKITFKESSVLSPGSKLTTFVVDNMLTVGLGICYDLRFAKMAISYANYGCHLLLYPGAFNKVTGPLHWELLLRARAVDNQMYIAGISPATDEKNDYVSYGHSMLIDPWGKIDGHLNSMEDSIIREIDLNVINEIRQQIPIRQQSKNQEIYDNFHQSTTN